MFVAYCLRFGLWSLPQCSTLVPHTLKPSTVDRPEIADGALSLYLIAQTVGLLRRSGVPAAVWQAVVRRPQTRALHVGLLVEMPPTLLLNQSAPCTDTILPTCPKLSNVGT